MPADEGVSFLLYCAGKEEDALLYERWIVHAQFEMSFAEYKHKLTPVKMGNEDEILSDVESIMTSWEAKNGNI